MGIDVSAQDNYTTWLLRHYNIDSTNRKSVPYLAINLILAQQMGWVVETANNMFAVCRPACISPLLETHGSESDFVKRGTNCGWCISRKICWETAD